MQLVSHNLNAYDSLRYALVNRWDPSHLKKVDSLLTLNNRHKVLEVGCGQGHLTRRLAERGFDATGIDANPNAVKVAGTDRVVHMRAEALKFPDATFDAVISAHSLEHIPDLEQAISEQARVLKPGGLALHIYPAEPIRGLYAIPASLILYRTPFKARRVHCHKLWPSKLQRMKMKVGLTMTHTEFRLWTPEFVSVFEKTN